MNKYAKQATGLMDGARNNEIMVKKALVHATLAVAEEQRIANVIAMANYAEANPDRALALINKIRSDDA